jgi:starch phosphorylase
MKAAVNGTLNLSFLDGWWDEAYTPEVGWAIGEAAYENEAEQDRIEAQAVYNLLEREIVPKFYDRDAAALPRKWIAMMKKSIHKLGAYFNTHRMVAEYSERFYLPAHRAGTGLRANGERRTRDLAAWRRRIAAAWPEVGVRCEKPALTREIGAGDRVTLTVRANLAALAPEDVRVEICHGILDGGGQMTQMQLLEMSASHAGDAGNKEHIFTADFLCAQSGRIGYACRILPRHPDLVHPYTPFHLTWEQDVPR